MKKEDKIELAIAITMGAIAIVALFFMSNIPEPIGAVIFSLGATGCFFFTMSFNQRHHRNKDT